MATFITSDRFLSASHVLQKHPPVSTSFHNIRFHSKPPRPHLLQPRANIGSSTKLYTQSNLQDQSKTRGPNMSLRHTLTTSYINGIKASIEARSPQATAGAKDPNPINYTPIELQLAHALVATHRKAMTDHLTQGEASRTRTAVETLLEFNQNPRVHEDDIVMAGTYDIETTFLQRTGPPSNEGDQPGPRNRKSTYEASLDAELDSIDDMLLASGQDTEMTDRASSTSSQATEILPNGFRRPDDISSQVSTESDSTTIIVDPTTPPTSPFAAGGQRVVPARVGAWWSSGEVAQLEGDDYHGDWLSSIELGAGERRRRVLEEFEAEVVDSEEVDSEEVEGEGEGEEGEGVYENEEDAVFAMEVPVELPKVDEADGEYGKRVRKGKGGSPRKSLGKKTKAGE